MLYLDSLKSTEAAEFLRNSSCEGNVIRTSIGIWGNISMKKMSFLINLILNGSKNFGVLIFSLYIIY